MRTFAVAAVLAALTPSTASAETSLCPTAPGSHEYQRALMPLVMGQDAQGVARAAVGGQVVGVWFDTPRQGWSVAVAPGAHDLEAARAAIVTALEARYTPEAAALLTSTLTVLPTPYSEAELATVHSEVAALAARNADVVGGYGIGCRLSYGYRVEVTTPLPHTPENVARLEALLGRFGDLVRVEHGFGGATPVGVAPPLDVARYASVPRTSRCVRGRAVGVRAAKDTALLSVTLTAGKRSVTAERGKRARLALKRRSTRVTLTVQLRDGSTGARTFTYRRCR